MPNDLSGNPWKLTDVDDLNPISPNFVFISSISWEGYANANHHVMLKDYRGVPVFESFGNLDLSPITKVYDRPMPVFGLKVSDLGSGRVLLHV